MNKIRGSNEPCFYLSLCLPIHFLISFSVFIIDLTDADILNELPESQEPTTGK